MRYQIVMMESAIDYYLHGIFKYGMVNMFNDDWDKTETYLRLKVSMEDVDKLRHDPYDLDWFNILVQSNDKTSFLSKSQIDNVLKSLDISIDDVADRMGYINKQKLLKDLKQIADRRNCIVHQLDINDTRNERKSLNIEQNKKYISIVNDFINGIHDIILGK